jgi:ribosomal RNA assembly protein
MFDKETYVKIPMNRIGALIGQNGQDKKNLEEITLAKINVDSNTGEVTLRRAESDAFVFYRLAQLIKAIGRGFSPEKAKLLLDESNYFEIIELKEKGLKTEKQMANKRGRVIGAHGTVKKFLEDTLDCHVAIQGKTIAIIGPESKIAIAYNAIEDLIEGSSIPSVRKKVEGKLNKSKPRIFD